MLVEKTTAVIFPVKAHRLADLTVSHYGMSTIDPAGRIGVTPPCGWT